MGHRQNELRNAAGLILKLRVNVVVQDLKISFYMQILVPPTFGNCPLTSFALATALYTRRLRDPFCSIRGYFTKRCKHKREGNSGEKRESTVTKQQNYLKSQKQGWSRGHNLRGQGHKKNPRPRPRTDFSRPRTGMLEAKTKDQGHNAQLFSTVLKKEKKVTKNIFLTTYKKKVLRTRRR